MKAMRACALWLLIGAVAASCKKEETSQAAYPPGYQPYPPATHQPLPPATGTDPPPATGPGPAPTAPAPGPTAQAVMGLPCAYDTDIACPFARCINGRCGGCASSEHCKPGAACLATPLGLACMPSGAQVPPPGPTAAPTTTAQPAPTTPPAPTATTPPAPTDPYAALRARCLDRTNQYRQSGSQAALVRRSNAEGCADGAARSDADTKTPHGSFRKCNEAAQNECPGWQGTPEQVLDSCLKMMFDEGPGEGPAHGHYRNIMDPAFRSVACGVHIASDGSVWIVQNFYR